MKRNIKDRLVSNSKPKTHAASNRCRGKFTRLNPGRCSQHLLPGHVMIGKRKLATYTLTQCCTGRSAPSRVEACPPKHPSPSDFASWISDPRLMPCASGSSIHTSSERILLKPGTSKPKSGATSSALATRSTPVDSALGWFGGSHAVSAVDLMRGCKHACP